MDRRSIALNALLSHPKAKLVANANHKDNFTLWAAPIVWDAIVYSFENITKNGPDCDEFNKLCDEATIVIKGRGQFNQTIDYKIVSPTKSPLATSICHEVYANLNPNQRPTSYQDPLPRKM